MASRWQKVGEVALEDESLIVVHRRDGLFRLGAVVPDNGVSIVLNDAALSQLRELLDRAAMPGVTDA